MTWYLVKHRATFTFIFLRAASVSYQRGSFVDYLTMLYRLHVSFKV